VAATGRRTGHTAMSCCSPTRFTNLLRRMKLGAVNPDQPAEAPFAMAPTASASVSETSKTV